MKEAVIVSAVRTPLGSFNGSLAGIGATDLGALVIEEATRRAGIEKTDVNEVIMGQVLPCGYGQNPAKQAAVKAGMPWEVEAITVNKVCGSALKTVMLAAQAVRLGVGSEHERRKQAAEILGISPRTLRYKLAKLRDAGIAIPV